MQFIRVLRERIRRGEITCSVRLWQRPRVRVGGRYALPPGQIVVTSLLEMPLADVTPSLARRSGFAGLVELLKIAKHGSGRRVYLVEFRYVKPGSRKPKRPKRKRAHRSLN
ncbi:MAG: ASCH domain-containing protein [bacterium]